MGFSVVFFDKFEVWKTESYRRIWHSAIGIPRRVYHNGSYNNGFNFATLIIPLGVTPDVVLFWIIFKDTNVLYGTFLDKFDLIFNIINLKIVYCQVL